MLNDTIENQLKVLKDNIEWTDFADLSKVIKALSYEDALMVQVHISALNNLLIDGRLD